MGRAAFRPASSSASAAVGVLEQFHQHVGGRTPDRFVVEFEEEIDIVDAQVVPAVDGDLPQPTSAYIAETRIDIPVGDVRPVGRGAFGRTKRLTLIIEAQEVDPTIQIAELKFWRVES